MRKTFFSALLAVLLLSSSAFAAYKEKPNVSNVTGTLPVANGGTGLTSFTRTGNSTLFATSTGALTANNCIKSDANGNFVDAGAACGAGGSSTQSINTVTNNYTLVLADAEKLVIANKATAMNITVPLNSSVAFPTGTRIPILGYGAGAVTVVATGGVTIRSPLTLVLSGQYAKAELQKIGTDEWSLEGRLQ